MLEDPRWPKMSLRLQKDVNPDVFAGTKRSIDVVRSLSSLFRQRTNGTILVLKTAKRRPKQFEGHNMVGGPQQRRRYILFSLWCLPNILPEGFSPARLLLPTTDPRIYHSLRTNNNPRGSGHRNSGIAWRFFGTAHHHRRNTCRTAVHDDIIPWTPVVPQDDTDWMTMGTTTTSASVVSDAIDAAVEQKQQDDGDDDDSYEMIASDEAATSVASHAIAPAAATASRTPLPSDPRLDLSGTWKLQITDQFKQEYDTYLQRLGQPMFVRSIAVSLIGRTTEATRQTGNKLWIQSTNPRGVWERILVSDGSLSDLKTIDKETVQAEAWWEGSVHHSWLRGVTKYGGGSFESQRFLETDTDTLCCASTFHPNDPKRPPATVTWRFIRTNK